MYNVFLSDMFLLGVAYLLGSLPFGLMVSRIFDLKDPRTVGSQNIGATNILRLGNKKAAFLTFLLDSLKGSVAVTLASLESPSLAPLAGICAVIGHVWPLWLGFRGGKGIATTFGVIGVLHAPLALLCALTWAAVAAITRYSSLAALVSVVLSPFYLILLGSQYLGVICILMLIIMWTHRHNIGRLITGREAKIGDPRSS